MKLRQFLTALVASILTTSTLVSANPETEGHCQVVDIQRHHDGNDIWVEATSGSTVVIWGTSDFKTWIPIDVAAEIQPGLFTVHHPNAQGETFGFYMAATLQPDCQPMPEDFAERLVNDVPFVEDLESAQRQALEGAAAGWHQLLNELVQKRQQLLNAQRQLADCLKTVAEARLAMQQAEADAQAAEADADQADKDADQAAQDLKQLYDDADHAASERDRWAREMQVLLDWAARYEREGNAFHAQQLRDNADSYHQNYQDWANEAQWLEGQITNAETQASHANDAANDAAAAAMAAQTAAQDARDAYEAAKQQCDPKRDAVDQAVQEVVDAETAEQTAKSQFGEAESTATDQGRTNRKRREEEEANNEDDEVGDDSQDENQPSGIRPTNRAREIAEFLEFIRVNGGTKDYEKALRSMFAKELEAGLVTLQGLSSGMQQLAKGLPANPADFARGMSMGLLQFGYGMIASWVQSAIEGAVVRISNKRIANIGANDVPVRGDAKCNINKKNGTAELYLRNENNTVTVLTYRNSAGLTGGTYKVW